MKGWHGRPLAIVQHAANGQLYSGTSLQGNPSPTSTAGCPPAQGHVLFPVPPIVLPADPSLTGRLRDEVHAADNPGRVAAERRPGRAREGIRQDRRVVESPPGGGEDGRRPSAPAAGDRDHRGARARAVDAHRPSSDGGEGGDRWLRDPRCGRPGRGDRDRAYVSTARRQGGGQACHRTVAASRSLTLCSSGSFARRPAGSPRAWSATWATSTSPRSWSRKRWLRPSSTGRVTACRSDPPPG